MRKKWLTFSLCALAVYVLAMAYSELDDEMNEKEEL